MTPYKHRKRVTKAGGVLSFAEVLGLGAFLSKKSTTVNLLEGVVEPGREIFWIVQCSVPVDLEGISFKFPAQICIVTDLRYWAPLIKKTKTSYVVYGNVLGNDTAKHLLDMDLRDLQKISEAVIKKVEGT